MTALGSRAAMKARFLHVADCHLGYRQYNSAERLNDFARAFFSIMDVAVAEKVDFVVLAGDLFQKRAIDALTLNQAMHGLEKLHEAAIPCLAVEGNHEHAYLYDHIGWMEFLAQRQLLQLLNPTFRDGKAELIAYDKRQRRGSYSDPLPGLRVHGMRYMGSGTARAIEGYAAALEESADQPEYSIFIAHTGIEGVLAEAAGGLNHRQLAVLKPHIDYLALGHIHKPFSFDDWIYNPGSPEACAVVESDWSQRGYYLVDIDTSRADAGDEDEPAPAHTATLHANPRRIFHRLSLKVDHLQTPEQLMAELNSYLARKAADHNVARLSSRQRPVVELQLTGVLPFDRAALDLAAIEAAVEKEYDPLVALIKNLTRGVEFQLSADEQLDRPALERQVFTELLERDARFRPRSEEWSQALVTLKRLALDGAGADAILDEVAASAALLETADAE